MSKFSNWFKNLKIRWKLFIILSIIVTNFLLFYVATSFFNNTTRSFVSILDGERNHTQYFEMGISSFFMYVNDHDSTHFKDAILYIEKANQLAEAMVSIDSLVQNTTQKEFRHIYWDYYAETMHFDKDAVNLFADRTRLFVKLRFSILMETYAIAAKGYNTGIHVIDLMNKYKATGNPQIIEELSAQAEIIHEFYLSFSMTITNAIKFGNKLLRIISISILVIVLLISIISINWITNYLYKNLSQLSEKSKKLALGDVNIETVSPSKDEIGLLYSAYNTIVESMKGMVTYANAIAEGNYNNQMEPRSPEDTLTIALNSMAASLKENRLKTEAENWQSEGINNLNREITGNLNIEIFAKKTLRFLIDYFGAINGCFYLVKDNELELFDHLGIDTSRIKQRIPLGSGIYSKAFEKNLCTHINNLDYLNFKTFTGTGEISPNEIVIIPLTFNENPLGIIEIASTKFDNIALILLNTLREIISISLHVNISHFQVTELLSKTQQQAEELEVQQEELRTSNAELEEQTQLLRDSEAELEAQQEELRVTNEELQERTNDLEIQRNEVIKNSKELEKAKDAIEQKAKEVEIASKYKSEFLANMSHELRTPLNSLLLLSKDLASNKRENLDESQVESAKIIYNSGNDLLTLINDILDLSKIESGKMLVNPEYMTLSDIEEDITSVFSHLAKEKGLFFNTIIKNDDITVFTDRQKVNQVLKNFVSNAVKFTSNGGITITFVNNNDGIIIEVADTGIGIPNDKQLEIFEAFQQVDGSISRKYGGTGLGLSISRELAKLLAGKITLQSTVGNGSVFALHLPINFNNSLPETDTLIAQKNIQEEVKKVPEPPKIIQDENNNKSSGEIIYIPDDRDKISKDDKTILIIEDDLELAKNLTKQCYDEGFKCIVSGTGENGLVLTEKYKPDAIILDIRLPGIDGYKVLEILKDNPETRHIPVQLMSAYDPERSSANKLSIGFLQKPIIPEELDKSLKKIATHINKNIKDLLIIEDDEANRIMISKLLGGKDVKVTVTDSGTEAMKLIQDNNFDCVVLDLGIKDMNGLELVKQMSIKCKKRIPPIIVYTARDLTMDETRELQRHTKSIIIKGAMSDSRLLDETALFLHRVVDDMSENKKKIIKKLHNKEAVFENKTVLLVDDDMRNVFALTKILEDHNLNVIEAENGQVAIDKLNRDKSIDIVLMDVMMPVMDGLTAIEKIRASGNFNKLPIIVLTAKAMKEDRLNAIKAGANDYLSKPIDTDKLLSLMRVWLYNK